jgi:hypothetical protein
MGFSITIAAMQPSRLRDLDARHYSAALHSRLTFERFQSLVLDVQRRPAIFVVFLTEIYWCCRHAASISFHVEATRLNSTHHSHERLSAR